MMISDIQEQECIDQCIGIPIYRTIYRNRNALINALEFLYKNHIIYRNSDALINASEFLYKKHFIYRNFYVLIKRAHFPNYNAYAVRGVRMHQKIPRGQVQCILVRRLRLRTSDALDLTPRDFLVHTHPPDGIDTMRRTHTGQQNYKRQQT